MSTLDAVCAVPLLCLIVIIAEDSPSAHSPSPSQVVEKKKNLLIDDASTFLTMTTPEKREWVRNTDLHPSKFPRPREGPRALDAVMLPMLDIEVGAITPTLLLSLPYSHSSTLTALLPLL